MRPSPSFLELLERYAAGAADAGPEARALAPSPEDARRALPSLEEFFAKDRPIAEVERAEIVLKSVLRTLLGGPMAGEGELARDIARFQQRLGFTYKFKSYAVKATTPLGYSVFVQRPREGFSFQCHLVHKVEVFHIIDCKPGGFLFVCSLDDWRRAYDREAFERWLGGAPDARYDRFRHVPRPGDVVLIDSLGVVHTAIGCVLEEYATVSTDMVERLHDQNIGRPVPPDLTRAWAADAVGGLSMPAEARLVGLRDGGGFSVAPIAPVAMQGGAETVLADFSIGARRFVVERGQATTPATDDARATLLRMWRGNGELFIGTRQEAKRPSPPTLAYRAGDMFMLPAGLPYAVFDRGAGTDYSEHRVALADALV